MPEPTTTTAATSAGLAAVSFLPFINGNALLGAVLGAAFVAYFEKDLSAKQRVGFMLLCVGFGYLLGPEITHRTQYISSDATASMIAAIFSIYILIKLLEWVKKSTLAQLWKSFRGGGNS
ncbi:MULTISPECIES: putative holin [unclassified Acinetobacter]|uniref:putative holin n=1 Tax=unclassified Acinetobacter TaxID=196816 RepID=UPI00190C4ED9|nr:MULTISPECIES: putative holin [unclassified Acinetobacter]MBK0062625.1 hypothetical protein [Acinetobacter sp. S55]MBK0065798.1 hypothetical protein [Acinetobacter sp. S54]